MNVKEMYERYPFPPWKGDAAKHLAQRLERLSIRGKDVLDIGCGTGLHSCALGLMGFNVTGIDISSSPLAYAEQMRKKMGLRNVAFERKDLFSFKQKKRYDVVISIGALHHIPDTRRAFKETAKFVKPGGTLLIALYNSYYIPLRIARWLTKHNRPDIKERLKFAKKHKKALLLLSYAWRAKGKFDMPDAWLVDTFCHVYDSYHSYPKVKRWFKEEGFGDVSLVGSPAKIFSSGILYYIGKKSWVFEGYPFLEMR